MLIEPLIASAIEAQTLLPYVPKVKDTQPFAHWSFGEASGSVAHDSSGFGNNALVTGASWGAEGIGDGHTALTFDGINDVVNVYSPSLAAAFNGNEGTALFWLRSDAWADGQLRFVLRFLVNASNLLEFAKYGSSGMMYVQRKGSGTAKVIYVQSLLSTEWIVVAITWSKSANQMKAFKNGVQVGSTLTGITDFVGVPGVNQWGIGGGSGTTGGGYFWAGSLAHVVLWPRALDGSEVEALSDPAYRVSLGAAQLEESSPMLVLTPTVVRQLVVEPIRVYTLTELE